MIVLRVMGEGVGDERKLRLGIAELGDEETTVVPALVVLDKPFDHGVGPLQFIFKGETKCDYGLVAILPAAKDVRSAEEWVAHIYQTE